MPDFVKLSAGMWEILACMVRSRTPSDYSRYEPWITRRDVLLDKITESERVSAVRAHASLVRRGLIAPAERLVPWRPVFTLAVPPRAVLSARATGT